MSININLIKYILHTSYLKLIGLYKINLRHEIPTKIVTGSSECTSVPQSYILYVSKNIGNFCNIDEMTFYSAFDSIFNFFDSFILSLNLFKYFMNSVQTILSLPSLYSLTTEKLQELLDN